MPRYDYKCECGNIWEVTHSIHEDAESLGLTCPECESGEIFRYLGNYGTVGIRFKGTGFAINDLALDKLGVPKSIRDNPETASKIFD